MSATFLVTIEPTGQSSSLITEAEVEEALAKRFGRTYGKSGPRPLVKAELIARG